jgi:hypothetical protein
MSYSRYRPHGKPWGGTYHFQAGQVLPAEVMRDAGRGQLAAPTMARQDLGAGNDIGQRNVPTNPSMHAEAQPLAPTDHNQKRSQRRCLLHLQGVCRRGAFWL